MFLVGWLFACMCACVGSRTVNQHRSTESGNDYSATVASTGDAEHRQVERASELRHDSVSCVEVEHGRVEIVRDSTGQPVVLQWYRKHTANAVAGADRTANHSEIGQSSYSTGQDCSSTQRSQIKTEAQTKVTKSTPAPVALLLTVMAVLGVVVFVLRRYVSLKFI